MAYDKYKSATEVANVTATPTAVTVEHDAIWYGGDTFGDDLIVTLANDTVAVTFGNIGKGCFLPIEINNVTTCFDMVLLESGKRFSN